MEKYDFSGYATKYDIQCTDGKTIRKNAFKDCDGKQIPLVWNHNHYDPLNVLGHAVLEHRDDGVFAYGFFNDTEAGKTAKELTKHGDISSLSIWANSLKQKSNDVLHGAIREVSLVLAGANPKAYIESVISHGELIDDEAIIYFDEPLSLQHSEEVNNDEFFEDKDVNDSLQHSEENKDKTEENEETIADIFDTLNDKQKKVVYSLVGTALQEVEEDDEEEVEHSDKSEEVLQHNDGGGNIVKKNVFDKTEENTEQEYLSHSAQGEILELAKKGNVGSFKRALEVYSEENDLGIMHADISGFVQTGEGNVTTLFPEYKDVRPGAPELITNDQGWITTVLNKVHKSPISRIRTKQVDIRKIQELRAKGYKKGNKKTITGNYSLVTRTTDPQTVYVKNALHRDDVVDITDFDYVKYMYDIDRLMLNEELATAIMLGDGRDEGDPDKISPEHIRPIWTDDDLYTLHVDLDLDSTKSELQGTNTGANFGANFITAESMVNTILYSREKYKGSGTPDLFITPHMLNVMLLARDINGRRIYSSTSELASSLNVAAIHTAEQFEGKTRTADGKTKKLLAIICNLSDYSLGATRGGEITHFTDFDIDFNQLKSLLETRSSGALTKVQSAIVIEEDTTQAASI